VCFSVDNTNNIVDVIVFLQIHTDVYVYAYEHALCNILQHNTAHYSTLQQHTASFPPNIAEDFMVPINARLFRVCFVSYVLPFFRNLTATHCNALEHTATHCNTQLHVARPNFYECVALCVSWGTFPSISATHCNTLQHTAIHCNTLFYRVSCHGCRNLNRPSIKAEVGRNHCLSKITFSCNVL